MNQNRLDIGMAAHFHDERRNFRKVWAGSDDTEYLQQGSYRKNELSKNKYNTQKIFTTRVRSDPGDG